jgi:glutamine synthetase
MAKPDHRWIGSSCHIHSSLWKDDRNTFDGESDTFKRYLAGHIAYAAEIAIFLAPNINSYKRYAAASWAPTTLAWGHDNRTCGFRIVGHGQHLRTESRLPGADVNPYLAIAALIAAGLHGIEQKLELGPAFTGNAYESDVQRFPHALRDAITALEKGKMLRKAFGDDVVDHYLNYARTEQSQFDKVVTGYERERLFERG